MNTSFDENSGTNKLANVLLDRMNKVNENSLVLDFGEIQANGSLLTNTFPVPIPKGQYSLCRQLTLGETGGLLSETREDGSHEHREGIHSGHISGNGSHAHVGGSHAHSVVIPEKMRSVGIGDRVLVAWVQNEAVIIDIIVSS